MRRRIVVGSNEFVDCGKSPAVRIVVMDSSAPNSPTAPGWRLNEVASAGRENLDADHVARYDSKEDAGAVDEVELLTTLGLTSSCVVVEFGVGTGQFALAVAPWCRRVVAVDVSPPMLARLQAKIDGANLGNVEVVQSGFVSYEHSGEPADFVYSRFALHHLRATRGWLGTLGTRRTRPRRAFDVHMGPRGLV